MNDFARMVLTLSKDEFFALRDCAKREYRHPRDQARYILRSVLLGDAEPDGAVLTSEVSAPVCTSEPIFSP